MNGWGGFFDVPSKREKLKGLEAVAARPEFWNDPRQAQKVMRETNAYRSDVERFEALSKRLADLEALHELALEASDEAEMAAVERDLAELKRPIDDLSTRAKLSGPMDRRNAILSLHAGAGGTEACDWVQILFRMYQRWAESKGFAWEPVDLLPGEEAGIKRVAVMIKGDPAYGLLKSEAGVHRLVRISPFDSNARRHTSFAACDVLPELDDDVEIEIKDADLRVDTYRAGGHGGQYVNKTESAVRITHLPSGIVVQSQSERSQGQNREMCWKMLKAKLYDLEMEKQRAVAERHYDSKGDIAWGNQIRSYVFMPYQLVKDIRSGYESSQVQAVIDGDLDAFMNAYLEWKLSGLPPRRSAAEE